MLTADLHDQQHVVYGAFISHPEFISSATERFHSLGVSLSPFTESAARIIPLRI